MIDQATKYEQDLAAMRRKWHASDRVDSVINSLHTVKGCVYPAMKFANQLEMLDRSIKMACLASDMNPPSTRRWGG